MGKGLYNNRVVTRLRRYYDSWKDRPYQVPSDASSRWCLIPRIEREMPHCRVLPFSESEVVIGFQDAGHDVQGGI